jgi:hypothetical protein
MKVLVRLDRIIHLGRKERERGICCKEKFESFVRGEIGKEGYRKRRL